MTGGQSSVILWIDVATFSLFAYTIGFWPLWIVLVVPLGLVTWVVGKFSPGDCGADRPVFHTGGLDPRWHQRFSGDGADTHRRGFPTQLIVPPAGALLVLVEGSLLSAGLLIAVRRIQMPTQDLAPMTMSRTLAPLPWTAAPQTVEPTEEFWSPEPVIAWRAWQWTGSVLRGVLSPSGPVRTSSPGVTTAPSRRDGTIRVGSTGCLDPVRWTRCFRADPMWWVGSS